MAGPDAIGLFVRDALVAGCSRDEIAGALAAAGWRERDIARALGHFAETGFVPPVPRPQPFVSARDAFFFGLAFVALVVSVVNTVSLAFEAVEWAVGADERAGVAWDVAALLVFGPLFWWLDRRGRQAGGDGPMRKIFGYGALFCACLVLLAALVTVLALALGGGLDLEVTLKALVVAGIAALVLGHYRGDLRGDARAG